MDLMDVTRQDIDAAAERIAGRVRVTPAWELARGALGGDWVPVLKLEFLQHTGSFKPRGAFNALMAGTVPTAGVAAVSGGNHGAAVAFAAARLGVSARIFVPEYAPPEKVSMIRRHGAVVEVVGAQFAETAAAYARYLEQSGALGVHPFGEPATIAGQGTVAREWAGQAQLDSVLIAVGGGGLVAGAAVWFEGIGTRVIGVEPEGAASLRAAIDAGRPVDVPIRSVAADSLGAPNVGELVYRLCRKRVAGVLVVEDSAIKAAQALLWRDWRIAVEPGGATALAAVISGRYVPRAGERLGVLLCGANFAPETLAGIAG